MPTDHPPAVTEEHRREAAALHETLYLLPYSIRLVRMTDEETVYSLTMEGSSPAEYPSHEDALDALRQIKIEHVAQILADRDAAAERRGAEKARQRCPFDDDSCDLDEAAPCPVCGMTGSLSDDNPDRCVGPPGWRAPLPEPPR